MDAKAALNLYLKFSSEWENDARSSIRKVDMSTRHLEGERFKIKTCNRFSELEIEEHAIDKKKEELQPQKH